MADHHMIAGKGVERTSRCPPAEHSNNTTNNKRPDGLLLEVVVKQDPELVQATWQNQ
jgi:hypothetical protein